MEIKVCINEELYRRFAAACVLTGKDQQTVISEKVQEFVTATFVSEMAELPWAARAMSGCCWSWRSAWYGC